MYRTGLILSVVALTACGDGIPITPPKDGAALSKPSAEQQGGRLPTYVIEKLPTLGGTSSRGNSINDRDWVAGSANLPNGLGRHAALWRDDVLTDLKTLGGANSSVAWPGQNDRGMVVGIAETNDLDSLNEDWSCATFFGKVTHHVCRGFVWEDGTMRGLPTFGGTHGFATGVNDGGEVVGWAETTVHDPTCNTPQVLQFRAALWDTRTGVMHQLRPLQGDSTSAATAINESGQVVGISGKCDVAVGDSSAIHAVLWDHGHAMSIGTLGGELWNTPMDINKRGDVVGFSDLPGDANMHAFFWSKKEGIKDLKTLPGDGTSQAAGINSQGQIVGVSCGEVACHAVTWLHGQIFRLDSLIAPGFPDSLASAQDINEEGVITGRLVEAGTGLGVPFVARPRRDGDQ